MTDFAERLASLKVDADRSADPLLQSLRTALKDADAAIDRLRERGFTVDVVWPYGRGAAAFPGQVVAVGNGSWRLERLQQGSLLRTRSGDSGRQPTAPTRGSLVSPCQKALGWPVRASLRRVRLDYPSSPLRIT